MILKEVITYAKELRPDAIVIAGDIYDKSVPSAEAVNVFDEFLTDLLLNYNDEAAFQYADPINEKISYLSSSLLFYLHLSLFYTIINLSNKSIQVNDKYRYEVINMLEKLIWMKYPMEFPMP